VEDVWAFILLIGLVARPLQWQALLARPVILPSEEFAATFRGRLWLVWLTCPAPAA
jgi:hypothetical protein